MIAIHREKLKDCVLANFMTLLCIGVLGVFLNAIWSLYTTFESIVNFSSTPAQIKLGAAVGKESSRMRNALLVMCSCRIPPIILRILSKDLGPCDIPKDINMPACYTQTLPV